MSVPVDWRDDERVDRLARGALPAAAPQSQHDRARAAGAAVGAILGIAVVYAVYGVILACRGASWAARRVLAWRRS